MQRRMLIAAAALAPWAGARAHHGWSSFDTERPLFLEGRAVQVKWQNPHAEFVLELPPQPRLPDDLAQRELPAQQSPVDGKALLAKAALPRRKERRWLVELAPLTRLDAWKVQPLQPGDPVGVLGYTFKDEKGDAVLRAEYLFAGGKVYGLRSSPA